MALNSAFCHLTGYDKQEVLGRNCRFLAGHGSEPAVQAVPFRYGGVSVIEHEAGSIKAFRTYFDTAQIVP